MPEEPIKILLVDDSPTVLQGLREIIGTSPEFKLVAALSDPVKAVAAVELLHPDLIVMDFDMPGLDGAELTAIVMRRFPTPVLIVTGIDTPTRQAQAQFRALQAGAVDIISKAGLLGAARDEAVRRSFLRKLKVVAGVPVVRRWRTRATGAAQDERLSARPANALNDPGPCSPGCRLVAIAASTGGPPALQAVLSSLGPELPAPVAIVQHIGDEFLDGFITWLGGAAGRHIVKARAGERLEPGIVYVAPGEHHLALEPDLQVVLDTGVPLNGCRPSADRLFGSVATSLGDQAIGVLLTGMGRDGATGLKLMRQAGATTLVQAEQTCVVFGMPGEAVKLGAHSMILPLEAIGPAIRGLLEGRRPKS